MARPPLFLRGQGCCAEFACHSRDALLGEYIKAALGSHDVELVSIAATSVVSHNGCNSTTLPGGNIASRAGDGLHGEEQRPQELQSVATTNTDLRWSLAFCVASPWLFVLFVALLEDSTSGNSGSGRIPSVEQQSGTSSSFQTSDGLPTGSVACNSYHSTGPYVTCSFIQVSSSAPLHRPPAIFVNREGPWEITRKACHGAGLSRCPVLATTCTRVEALSMSEFRPTLAQDPCRWVCHT